MTLEELKILYPKSKIEETKSGFRFYPNVKSCIETSLHDDCLVIEGPNGKLNFTIPSDDKEDLETKMKSVLLCDGIEVIISQEQIDDFIETLFKGL
ncbi:MAG: hypothetical protein KBT35_08285 [Firmicutes bacterium]|nr:hypothetical protein [Candidatus Colivicinus equi]